MTIKIRPACVDDIPHVAFAAMQAFGGFAEVMYGDALPGRTVRDIMCERFARTGETSHFSNSHIVEVGQRVVGALHACPMDDVANDSDDPLIPEDRYRFFEPFEHLHAEGSYYVNAVAVYPEFQGRGIGRLLMKHAESQAVDRGFDTLSLHVFAENRGAITLYHRLGYVEAARSPVIPNPRLRFGGDLLLMLLTL